MALEHDGEDTIATPALPRGPGPRWRAPWRARLLMALVATVAGLGAGAGLAALAPAAAGGWLAILSDPAAISRISSDSVTFAVAAVTVSVLAGLAAYRVLRLWRLARGWRRYLAGLAQDLGGRQAARLAALGYVPLATASLSGTPGNLHAEPLATLLTAYPRAILAGDDGAGKTIALQRHAIDIARGAKPWRIFTGRQAVPFVISLPRYIQADPDPSGVRLGFLQAEVRRYGARMLAEQTPALLRHGQGILLFDGLDEVTPDQARDILRELSGALRQEYRAARVILACRTAALAEYLEDLPLLRHLPAITILPLRPDDVRAVVRRAGAKGQLGAASAEATLEAVERHSLLNACGLPATLVMLLDLVAAGQPMPATRAQLLSAEESLRFSQAGLVPAQLDRTRVALGFLALALRTAHLTEITGAQAWNERDAVRALLADTTTATATIGGRSRPMGLDPDQLAAAVDHACNAGVLERGADGQGLRFRHSLRLYLAAARHLDTQDAGLGRVSPLLLRPEWLEIVLLWGGLTSDPVGLAERLSRFATTPGGAAAAAGMADLSRAKPLALALALTIGVLSIVPLVVAAGTDRAAQDRLELGQQNLRDLFDRVLRFGVDDQGEQRARLTTALRACESGAAGELTPALALLVRAPLVNRLMRAQAVQVLGLLASPASLVALTALLLEPDPIVREALNRGFGLAGAEAVPALLDLLAAHPADDTIRRRALDALTAINQPAIPIALERLAAPTPAARAAAATTLGALRDRRALEPLLDLLHDREPTVYLAATRALGRLGDTKAQNDLLKLLADGGLEQRIAAIEALGLLRGDRAVKPLIKLLEDSQPRVRAAAAEALGHIGDARAVDPLRAHLGDKDPWAQAAATTALRALGQRA